MSHIVGVPTGFKPTGYVDFANVLYRATEILEFASRLALKGALGRSAVIEVGMSGIRDRVLLSLEARRAWRSFCPASVDSLAHPAIGLHAADLVAQRREVAVELAIWFYERFRWDGWDRTMLREMQRKFVENVWD